MSLADHARRIESIIRTGTIAAVDHGAVRCKVRSGGLLTTWLPWIAIRAGTTRTWSPPTVSEQVLLLCPSGEPAAGIVLLGLNSDSIDTPSHSQDEWVIDFPDHARITYNHATGAFSVTGIKTALIEASESVTVDTPETHITGNVTIDGDLLVKGMGTIMDLFTYLSGMAGFGIVEGKDVAAIIDGPFNQINGPLSSNGVTLQTHTHTGVHGGSDNSGPPSQ